MHQIALIYQNFIVGWFRERCNCRILSYYHHI